MFRLRVSAPCSTSPMQTVTSKSVSVHGRELGATWLQDGTPHMGTPSYSPCPRSKLDPAGQGGREPTPAGWRQWQQVRWGLNAKKDMSGVCRLLLGEGRRLPLWLNSSLCFLVPGWPARARRALRHGFSTGVGASYFCSYFWQPAVCVGGGSSLPGAQPRRCARGSARAVRGAAGGGCPGRRRRRAGTKTAPPPGAARRPQKRRRPAGPGGEARRGAELC